MAEKSNSCPGAGFDLDHLTQTAAIFAVAAAESGRSSLRQITTGPVCSVASIGMVITPEGKAVADSPSSQAARPSRPS
jgi:hypothetical protein